MLAALSNQNNEREELLNELYTKSAFRGAAGPETRRLRRGRRQFRKTAAAPAASTKLDMGSARLGRTFRAGMTRMARSQRGRRRAFTSDLEGCLR
jgi:hypothetical protein